MLTPKKLVILEQQLLIRYDLHKEVGWCGLRS